MTKRCCTRLGFRLVWNLTNWINFLHQMILVTGCGKIKARRRRLESKVFPSLFSMKNMRFRERSRQKYSRMLFSKPGQNGLKLKRIHLIRMECPARSMESVIRNDRKYCISHLISPVYLEINLLRRYKSGFSTLLKKKAHSYHRNAIRSQYFYYFPFFNL